MIVIGTKREKKKKKMGATELSGSGNDHHFFGTSLWSQGVKVRFFPSNLNEYSPLSHKITRAGGGKFGDDCTREIFPPYAGELFLISSIVPRTPHSQTSMYNTIVLKFMIGTWESALARRYDGHLSNAQ
jgi:hypothetical protein